MADRESAERAVKEANPIIDGRKANVNLAYLGAKPRNNAQNGKNEVQKYKNTKIQKKIVIKTLINIKLKLNS